MMKMTRVFQDREVSFECIEKNQRMIETLICSICQDFFKNPFMTSCGHNFCYDCLKQCLKQDKSAKKCKEHKHCKLFNCPLCREIVHRKNLLKNVNLSSSIDAIRVKCLQGTCDSTCSKEMFLEEKEHHLKNDCEHFLAVCKYNGCEVRNLLATRGEHELECLKNPNKKIHCPECLESVLAVLLNEHRKNDCPEGLVSCTETSLCKRKIKRCELEHHIKNETREHLDLVKIKYDELNRKSEEEKEKNIKRMKLMAGYYRSKPIGNVTKKVWDEEIKEIRTKFVDIAKGDEDNNWVYLSNYKYFMENELKNKE